MQKTVAVLGGGIGGLSACYYLSKSPQVSKIVLLEGSGRLGGWLHSTRREDGAVAELGLESELLPVTYDHVASKNRFLFVGGQLHKMPSGLGGVVRTVPPFSQPLVLSVLKELLIGRGKEGDETVHSFVSRRLGAELADIAIDCLCRGVFAGDCRKLSVRSCFPPLFNAEQARGSIVLGMVLGSGSGPVVPSSGLAQRAQRERWAQWSLRKGMQSLPDALEDSLKGRVQIHKHTPVKELTQGPGSWESLSEQLREISMVTVAVVNLEYEGSILPVGFGHLIPSSEDRALLGVMMGGAWFQEVFGSLEEVTEKCFLDRAIQADCIPQYHLGHWKRLENIRHYIDQHKLPLSLTGASYDGVSVNDVIFSGRKSVESLVGEV
ncbi:hypothetical protein JZ751_004742 [Albula glossodonta]|uniref:Protoporphyrinogen oxidase n=1 Tax=Albula glossodonta TaxID=121402 RepID=A0A8T2N7P7_9TELE|nr:hypothetical protein JZ751_004742 [Albula glossodonta]